MEAIKPKVESVFLGRFEPLPKSVIAGVEINRDLLLGSPDPQLKRYLNRDNVIADAAKFAVGVKMVPDGTPVDQKRVQGIDMHRGFIIRFGTFFDEHGVAHGHIAVKGTGMSFRSVSDRKIGAEAHDPLGFFGLRHASQDQSISDEFAHYGGRTSRAVATIELNRRRFIDWYRRLAIVNDKYGVEEMLNIVKTNGDVPALELRLLGADRQDEVTRALRPYYTNKTDSQPVQEEETESEESYIRKKKFPVLHRPFTFNPMLMRAFKLISAEIAMKGAEKFQDEYEIPYQVFGRLRRAEQSLDIYDIQEALEYLQVHFFNWNRGVGNVIRIHRFNGKLHFNIHRGNYDALGTWVDWENALEESGQLMNGFDEPYRYAEYAIDKKKIVLNSIMQNARYSGELHAMKMIPGLLR